VNVEDYIGKTYNLWTIIKFSHKDSHKKNYFFVQCACGKKRIHYLSNVVLGITKSCGCLKKDTLLNKCSSKYVGKLFGRLTILKYISAERKVCPKFVCKCRCGCIRKMNAPPIIGGVVKSCGCLSTEKKKLRRKRNLIGKTFGRLTVIEHLDSQTCGEYDLLCQCVCGNMIKTYPNNIKSGNKKSCGCLRTEASLKNLEKGIGYISKTETYFFDQLEKLFNIKIHRQYRLENRSYDGYFKNKNLLIECDGDYWHSSTEAKQKDTYKTKLAENRKYGLLRVPLNRTDDVNKYIKNNLPLLESIFLQELKHAN
jgi:very-short-patch-repair endonuclease